MTPSFADLRTFRARHAATRWLGRGCPLVCGSILPVVLLLSARIASAQPEALPDQPPVGAAETPTDPPPAPQQVTPPNAVEPPSPASAPPDASATAIQPAPAEATGATIAPDETAGYHNGTFFVRDRTDTFRMYLQGRVHADWLDQFGPGTSSLPPGNGITNGFYLRRARLEVGGEFFKQWQWQLSAEFSSSTSIDNAGATQAQPTCAVSTTTAAGFACTNRESPVDNPTVKAIPTDVFVNYGPTPWTNFEVGQFLVPFTFENPLGDNTTPFLERSLAVRNIGVPLLRDIGAMFWGEAPDRSFYYKVAFLNGDGPNRANVDSRYDVAGRAVVRPFVKATKSFTRWAHIGVSARGGSRDSAAVGYDLPSLTTQGGYSFWKPTYKDSLGNTIHIMPSTAQWALAGDVYLPLGPFDVTGEFIYTADNTREAIDGLQLSPFTQRVGQLKGYGWYAQVAYWIVGDQSVVGVPNHSRPVHLDPDEPQRPWKAGVEALAKFEQLHLTYRGASRGGAADPLTPDGDIDVDDLAFGVNYWLTRHLRVGLNYTLYIFPDSAPVTPTTPGGTVQSSAQRAVAPGQLLAKGADDSSRNSNHTLNELQLRFGVQF
jgi:phosphate-selective porin